MCHFSRYCFVFTSQIELSVVLDFSASLNDVAPVYPMLFPVDLLRKEQELIVGECHLCVVSFVFTIQIEFHECCV